MKQVDIIGSSLLRKAQDDQGEENQGGEAGRGSREHCMSIWRLVWISQLAVTKF